MLQEEGRGGGRSSGSHAIMQARLSITTHRVLFYFTYLLQELEREKKDRIAATTRLFYNYSSFLHVTQQHNYSSFLCVYPGFNLCLRVGRTCCSSEWCSCKARATKRMQEQVV